MRDFIIGEIQKIAAQNGGKAPGIHAFVAATGITEAKWRGKYWARWGDALIEAGFQPNEWQGKSDSEILLLGVIAACRHYEKFPTKAEIGILRHKDPSIPSPKVIQNNFEGRNGLILALKDYIGNDAKFDDIRQILPIPTANVTHPKHSSKSVDGYVYLIKSGDFYKVGRSDDAERRFKQISVSLPDKAELFHTIRTDDPAGIEAYWHKRFAEKRANGEWFRLSAIDVSAFKRRKFQ